MDMGGPVVAVVGRSGSGKTRFIERLIPELRARGLAVAYVKHCHKGFQLDKKGKDSARVAEAGAEIVALVSPDETARLEKRRTTLPRVVSELTSGVDVILAEGFKSEAVRKVEVLEPGHPPVCQSDPDLIAVITDGKAKQGVPVFRTGDLGPFADFLEEEIVGKERIETDVELEVDGSPVDLNDFVRSIISSAVYAMVGNLRGVEEPSEIKLSIKRVKGGDRR